MRRIGILTAGGDTPALNVADTDQTLDVQTVQPFGNVLHIIRFRRIEIRSRGSQ